jgi:ABC-type sugar transport system ATPase subunit
MDGFMEEEFAIDSQDLRKSYVDVEALKGVDLKVRKGEIFGFLGPNGAGKTTTIPGCSLNGAISGWGVKAVGELPYDSGERHLLKDELQNGPEGLGYELQVHSFEYI